MSLYVAFTTIESALQAMCANLIQNLLLLNSSPHEGVQTHHPPPCSVPSSVPGHTAKASTCIRDSRGEFRVPSKCRHGDGQRPSALKGYECIPLRQYVSVQQALIPQDKRPDSWKCTLQTLIGPLVRRFSRHRQRLPANISSIRRKGSPRNASGRDVVQHSKDQHSAVISGYTSQPAAQLLQ